jgi:sec-independent protein translocase protein TatA
MTNFLVLGSLGWGEIAVIAFIVLLLFGGKKIPELMKGIGKGIRSFKEGMKDVEEDVNNIKAEITDSLEDEPKKSKN